MSLLLSKWSDSMGHNEVGGAGMSGTVEWVVLECRFSVHCLYLTYQTSVLSF